MRRLSILRDSIWGFVFGVVGVFFAVLAAYQARAKRSLAHWRGTTSMGEQLLTIRNAGSEPLLTEEFDRPLTVVFAGPLEHVEVTKASPVGLRPDVTLGADRRTVSIAPLLLNPGDRFTLAVGNSGIRSPEYTLEARIAGVRKVQRTVSPETRRALTLMRAALWSVLLSLPWLIFDLLPVRFVPEPSKFALWAVWGACALGLVGLSRVERHM